MLQLNMKESTVAFYCRVSTLLGQDPVHQLEPLKELSKNRDFDIYDTYVDIGVSGKVDRRPELNRLLRDARQGKFKILAIYSIDRLGRSTKQLLNLIDELSHLNVNIISVRENLDFTTPMGQMALTMISAVAQLEGQLISERIKTALKTKKLISERTNNGWKCGRPSISIEVKDEVLKLRKKGLSIRKISEQLGNISRSSVGRIINESKIDDPKT
jgi:DNA invertase Pin-like site-specific DNA recombinase